MPCIMSSSETTAPSQASFFFFFNDTATTEIYTLSLHDALPICLHHRDGDGGRSLHGAQPHGRCHADRKSTRLNSSHVRISYAVFCLKKKKHSPTMWLIHSIPNCLPRLSPGRSCMCSIP